jgi:hypothetical protein
MILNKKTEKRAYVKQIIQLHVWIDKYLIYYNLQCYRFSKQDTWRWSFVTETCREIEEKIFYLEVKSCIEEWMKCIWMQQDT